MSGSLYASETPPLKVAIIGQLVDAMRPRDTTFTIACTALALARINRFSGNRGFDSVAGHCLRVARKSVEVYTEATNYRATPIDRYGAAMTGLCALHHDDSEVVLGDMPGPVRAWLATVSQAYETLHDEVQSAMLASFFDAPGLPKVWRESFAVVRPIVDAQDRLDGLGMLHANGGAGSPDDALSDADAQYWIDAHDSYLAQAVRWGSEIGAL